ncbi:MAG: hypothetical protein JWO78_1772 [Micavibrio sp.]|nr:hypothetical protein [Micavibrio sp.]
MQKLFHKLTLRFAILLAAGVIAFSTASYADDPLCDGALWTQMTQRARLNGQQDISRAENLIYKADSILEYTCLQQFTDYVPTHVSYYMNPTLAGGAINGIISNWISSNYGHTYLGGRNGADPAANAGGGDYNCNTMDYVWKIAKCLHAGDLAPQDNLGGVYEFLTAPDSRMLPSACTGPSTATLGNAPVAAATQITLPPPLAATDCGTVIPTGTVVNLTETADTAFGSAFPQLASSNRRYNEKICANPACHYVPTDVDAGSCMPPQ